MNAPDDSEAPLQEALGYRAMGVMECLNVAGWVWRRHPSLLASLSLLGLLPVLGVLLALQYLAVARRLFVTSYDHDYLVLLAALLTPLLLGWRALGLGAMARATLLILRREASSEAEPPPTVRGLLAQAAERIMGLTLASLGRLCATWLWPALLWVLASTVDPEMDLEFRIPMVIGLVIFTLPFMVAASALTLQSVARAAMAEPGAVAPAGAGFFKALGLSFWLGVVSLLVFFNLHLGVGMLLFLADAFFDADVSYLQHFLSLSNSFYVCLLLGATWVLLDPVAAASTVALWISGQVERDAMDLSGRLTRVRRAPGRRYVAAGAQHNPSASGDRRRLGDALLWLLLGSAALWAPATAQAQEDDLLGQEQAQELRQQATERSMAGDLRQARQLLAEVHGEDLWRELEPLEDFAQQRYEQAEYPYASTFWAEIRQDVVDARHAAWDKEDTAALQRLRARLLAPALEPAAPPSERVFLEAEALRRELEEILAQEAFRDLAQPEVLRDNPSGLVERREKKDEARRERGQGLCGASGGGFGRPSGPASGVKLPQVIPSAFGFKVVAIGLLALALLLILVAIMRRVRRRGEPVQVGQAPTRPGEGGAIDEQVPGQEDALAFAPQDWRARALRLAEEGELRLALRALYLALLVALHRRQMIEYDLARTNWEYEISLRAWLRQRPQASQDSLRAFEDLTGLFELVWYGQHDLDRARFERSLQLADLVLGAHGEPDAAQEAP